QPTPPFASASCDAELRHLHSSPTRRSSDPKRPSRRKQVKQLPDYSQVEADMPSAGNGDTTDLAAELPVSRLFEAGNIADWPDPRSEEHTSELQSRENLVCRLLLEKKKQHKI